MSSLPQGSNEPIIDQKPQAEDVTEVEPATTEPPGAPEQKIEDDATLVAPSNGMENQAASPEGELKDKEPSPSHANGHTAIAAPKPEQETSAGNQDEHDDHVVEGEEDTVIY